MDQEVLKRLRLGPAKRIHDGAPKSDEKKRLIQKTRLKWRRHCWWLVIFQDADRSRGKMRQMVCYKSAIACLCGNIPFTTELTIDIHHCHKRNREFFCQFTASKRASAWPGSDKLKPRSAAINFGDKLSRRVLSSVRLNRAASKLD